MEDNANGAVIFIKHDDRYDFLDSAGKVIETMTPAQFEEWKAANAKNNPA